MNPEAEEPTISPNENPNMNLSQEPDSGNKNLKLMVVAGLAVVLIIVVGILWLLSNHPKNTAATTTPTPKPSASPSTTSAPSATPVATPVPSTGPFVVVGDSTLLDRGFTADQLNDTDYAFEQYAKSKGYQQAEITLSTVKSTQDANTGSWYMNFSGQFDASTAFTAKIDYTSIESIELWLYNGQGAQIYDSGVVTGKTP